MRFLRNSLLLTWILVLQDASYAESGAPPPVPENLFTSLKQQSPFTRLLNVSDTLVLTGIAHVQGNPVLTILDTENGRSIAVSETPNERGWILKALTKSEALDTATASIAFQGGEIVRIRYDKERIKSTAQRMKFKSQARSQMAAGKARQTSGAGHGVPQERVNMLKKIDQSELPKGYKPGAGKNGEESHKLHQNYVDKRMAAMSDRQKGTVGQMWKQKVAVDPKMTNRGASFVRIMEYVANHHPK